MEWIDPIGTNDMKIGNFELSEFFRFLLLSLFSFFRAEIVQISLNGNKSVQIHNRKLPSWLPSYTSTPHRANRYTKLMKCDTSNVICIFVG